MKKSNLDEMQEQKMLAIEHRGYWITFWGLMVAILIQGLMGKTIQDVVGEALVLALSCVYMAVSSFRHGLWDWKMKPNWKTNLIVSLLAGVVVGVFWFTRLSANNDDEGFVFRYVVTASVCVFAVCMLILSISMVVYKKRREKLDSEEQE